jgi:hypothetical protein
MAYHSFPFEGDSPKIVRLLPQLLKELDCAARYDESLFWMKLRLRKFDKYMLAGDKKNSGDVASCRPDTNHKMYHLAEFDANRSRQLRFLP